MKIPLFLSGAILAPIFVLTTSSLASLSIDSLSSPFVIDFTSFDGSGFSADSEVGQLNSNLWSVEGLSDDGLLDFGETLTSGDFARGISFGGETTGGIYAFNTGGGNVALGVQPGGSDWTPGAFVLRMQNDTGSILTALEISYSVYLYNDKDRSSSFNFSHSDDNEAYVQINALDFASPEVADSAPIWTETSLSTTIAGLSIANEESYYLSWSGNDISDLGSRDEFGLDNISISAVPEPKYFGLICGLIVLFVVRKRVYSLKSD